MSKNYNPHKIAIKLLEYFLMLVRGTYLALDALSYYCSNLHAHFVMCSVQIPSAVRVADNTVSKRPGHRHFSIPVAISRASSEWSRSWRNLPAICLASTQFSRC